MPLDMPAGEKRFISYRIDAKHQYIELARSVSISSYKDNISTEQKIRARIEGIFLLSCSFCLLFVFMIL